MSCWHLFCRPFKRRANRRAQHNARPFEAARARDSIVPQREQSIFRPAVRLPSARTRQALAGLCTACRISKNRKLPTAFSRKARHCRPPLPLLFCPSDLVLIGRAQPIGTCRTIAVRVGLVKILITLSTWKTSFAATFTRTASSSPLSKTTASSVTETGLRTRSRLVRRTYIKHIWADGAFWVGSADQPALHDVVEERALAHQYRPSRHLAITFLIEMRPRVYVRCE